MYRFDESFCDLNVFFVFYNVTKVSQVAKALHNLT